MKKIFSFLLFILMPLILFAYDDPDLDLLNDEIFDEVTVDEIAVDEIFIEYDDSFPEAPKWPFRYENRRFEIGFLNIGIGFSNNYLTAGEVFRDTLILDIDKFDKGLKFNLGFVFIPVYFNYNMNNNWGFGASAGLHTAGIIDISGNLLTISEAVDEKTDVSGAVFAELQLNGFFHVKDLKIKVKPSLYTPLVYARGVATYTLDYVSDGTVANLSYDFRLYTSWPQENFPDNLRFTASSGFDFTLGGEYPLAEVIGLKKRFAFLDFGIGLDFINIPIIPSVMRNYMELVGSVGSDEPINIFSGSTDWNSLVDLNYLTFIEGEENIFRPFKMLLWTDWRPFGNVVTFIPAIGFTVNPFYSSPFSMEGGIKTRIDVLNRFITVLGVNYEDRIWVNSVDLIFNFRAFEFELGVDFKSPDFVKSWTGGGGGINLGFRIGW